MRFLLCALLAGCGLEGLNDEWIGVYDVRSTVYSVQCNAPSNTPAISSLVVEVAKEDGKYQLYLCDQLGERKVLYGTSYDGTTFNGGADIQLFGCAFHESFLINLYHEDNGKVSGDSTTTLNSACASGVCYERSKLEGTKR